MADAASPALGAKAACQLIDRRLQTLGQPADHVTPRARDAIVAEGASGGERRLQTLLATALFLAETENAPRIDLDVVERATAMQPPLTGPAPISTRQRAGPGAPLALAALAAAIMLALLRPGAWHQGRQASHTASLVMPVARMRAEPVLPAPAHPPPPAPAKARPEADGPPVPSSLARAAPGAGHEAYGPPLPERVAAAPSASRHEAYGPPMPSMRMVTSEPDGPVFPRMEPAMGPAIVVGVKPLPPSWTPQDPPGPVTLTFYPALPGSAPRARFIEERLRAAHFAVRMVPVVTGRPARAASVRFFYEQDRDMARQVEKAATLLATEPVLMPARRSWVTPAPGAIELNLP